MRELSNFEDNILLDQIIKRLRVDNPWWTTDSIPGDYKEMSCRLYLNTFYPLVIEQAVNRAIILMGPRRVGKSVMLFHTVQRLIDDGVNPQKIIYLSIDTPIYNNISLERLYEYAKEALMQKDNNDGFYVIFDEIQYLKDWEVHLKSLVDTYRRVKFIASGSAAAALKMKSRESGAGRFTDFMLPPLTFNEYINLLGYDNLIVPASINWKGEEVSFFDTIDIDKLNSHFIDYINYGGYPELVLLKQVQNNPSQFVKNDIIDKVLLRDLPSLYGIQDIQELNRFFVHIVYRCGSEFSYDNLAKSANIKKETIKKYIQYLEAAFLIKVINKVDIDSRRFQRVTTFKIYLTNPSLRCALFTPLTETDDAIGNMIETAIYAQWMQRDNTEVHYASWRMGREQGEVDMVRLDIMRQKPYWAVEIKWSDRYFEKIGELDSLLEFMKKNKISEAVVTTIRQSGYKEFKDGKILFIPSSLYAYIAGYNTINTRANNIRNVGF